MTPTTQAILQSVATSDPNLSTSERTLLQRLLSGQLNEPQITREADAPLLFTQKQAARVLGVSRVTLWRMTKAAVFRPVEVTPGNFRYRRDEVESVAAGGHTATLRKPRERAAGMKVAASER